MFFGSYISLLIAYKSCDFEPGNFLDELIRRAVFQLLVLNSFSTLFVILDALHNLTFTMCDYRTKKTMMMFLAYVL